MNLPNIFTASRALGAPPEAVFKAFSDPGIIANWWGPSGFTNVIEEFDFTPGGHWRHDMIGPDGAVYPNRNPVGWFEIYVQDMDRAKTFYESVFQVGLEALPSPDSDLEMWVFPGMGCENQPGCTGALCKMKNKDSGTGGAIVYFSCEDCGETETRAFDAGGKVHLPKMSIGEYGHIALVIDPEGNMIGLHSTK